MNIMRNRNYLYASVVGSHMWEMNHIGSDHDVVRIYAHDIDRVLLGNEKRGGYEYKSKKYDITDYEIMHHINELKSMNVNHLWIATSPIRKNCYSEFNVANEIKELVMNNLSQQLYFPIAGCVKGNMQKYFNIKLRLESKIIDVDKKHDELEYTRDYSIYKWNKKIWTLIRTMMFGMNLLFGNPIYYPNPKDFFTVCSAKTIFHLWNDLIDAKDNSGLPLETDPEPFDDFLIKIRREMV